MVGEQRRKNKLKGIRPHQGLEKNTICMCNLIRIEGRIIIKYVENNKQIADCANACTYVS